MSRLRNLSASLGLAAAVGACGPAAAQVPGVSFVFPAGGQTGSTPTVTVGGSNLQGATGVLVSGEGVQAQIKDAANAGALALTLNIAPNAVPGVREVRVVTPRGTSNAGRLWVGAYPELNEVEPNNVVGTPQKLEKLPVTVNGQVNGGEDLDIFTFQATAGDTYVFDLVAYQMASALDGYLSLTDARGKTLQTVVEGFDRDPRLIHTFKQSGTYAIHVRDTMFRGGGNFVYKLTAGKIPAVTGYLPVGGKRGQKVDVTLEGVNLGGMKTMAVQIPPAGDRVAVPATTPAGMAVNPIVLTPSDLDEVVEAEPNDTPAQATGVPGSGIAVLNGRIDKPTDVDVFRIKPAAAGTLQFDLLGRRLGSRIDSFLRILDPTGKELQGNDDAIGKDSRLAFNVEAGKEYLVEVRNLETRAGGDVFYRLEIRPPGGQDFALTVTPDAINVGQSGSTAVTVNVTRQAGFAGAIQLRIDNLPAGLTASPAFIPAGQNATQFTLTAAAGATPGAMNQIKVVGTAPINNQPVERVAEPVEIYTPPLAQNNQTATRKTEFNVASVMPAQPYALEIEPKAVTVKRGQAVEIKIKAIRQMGQTAQIAIPNPANLPANVTPAPQPIPEKQNEAVLKLTVAANAPVVTQNVIITGNLSNNIQTAPALTLTITE